MKNNSTDLEQIFNKLYPNLPISERSNVCCVVDGEPVSWRVIYKELKHKTKFSLKALEIMRRTDII